MPVTGVVSGLGGKRTLVGRCGLDLVGLLVEVFSEFEKCLAPVGFANFGRHLPALACMSAEPGGRSRHYVARIHCGRLNLANIEQLGET